MSAFVCTHIVLIHISILYKPVYIFYVQQFSSCSIFPHSLAKRTFMDICGIFPTTLLWIIQFIHPSSQSTFHWRRQVHVITFSELLTFTFLNSPKFLLGSSNFIRFTPLSPSPFTHFVVFSSFNSQQSWVKYKRGTGKCLPSYAVFLISKYQISTHGFYLVLGENQSFTSKRRSPNIVLNWIFIIPTLSSMLIPKINLKCEACYIYLERKVVEQHVLVLFPSLHANGESRLRLLTNLKMKMSRKKDLGWWWWWV